MPALRPADSAPSNKAVRKAIERLYTHALREYWIWETARPLLTLRCVWAELPSTSDQPSEEELAQALIAYLKKAIDQVESSQYRKLLTIVLAADDAKLREATATVRRQEAGKRFRGANAKAVTGGTIRQHHEGKAASALAAVVIRDEEQLLQA